MPIKFTQDCGGGRNKITIHLGTSPRHSVGHQGCDFGAVLYHAIERIAELEAELLLQYDGAMSILDELSGTLCPQPQPVPRGSP